MLQSSRISDNLPQEISEKGNNFPSIQLFVVYFLILNRQSYSNAIKNFFSLKRVLQTG